MGGAGAVAASLIGATGVIMNVQNTGLSIVLSVIAMVASSVTTYLSFFDSRYEVTAVVASAPAQIQTSSSRSGDGPRQTTFRVYYAPTLILSNQGTRPVVVTEAALFRSTDPEGCVEGDVRVVAYGENEPFIFEPNAVRHMKLEFGPPAMTDDFEKRIENWCFGFVMFDTDGQRLERSLPALTASFEVERPEGEDETPALLTVIDFPRGPQTLAAGGWLADLKGD